MEPVIHDQSAGRFLGILHCRKILRVVADEEKRPCYFLARVDQQRPTDPILIEITQMDVVPVGAVIGIGGEAIREIATGGDSVLWWHRTK